MKRYDDALPRENEGEGSPPVAERECDSGDPSAEGASCEDVDMAALAESLAREKQDLEDALARARADFYNYRKRVERDRQKERAMITEDNVLDFLPVLTIWTGPCR